MGVLILRSVPAGSAPVNTSAPVVSGTARVGSALSCSTGSWDNEPTSYTYQWLRDGDPISGATSSTYQLQSADVGADVSCEVTASNAVGSAAQVSNEVGPVEESETGVVDLSGLPTSAAANTSAYTELDVPSMSAGAAFSDPVTGVRTVKLTSAATGSGASLYPYYSTLGLQISQPWGENKDRYTVALGASAGGTRLIDYQIGGGISNVRSFPGTEARFAFSRLPGQERIAYITSGSQLRRYDTEANAYADTGPFPYSWNTGLWFQLNHDETWATSLASSSNAVTALRLSDGAVISQTSLTGLDEIYSGHGNQAFINRGASNSQIWDLGSNSLSAYSRPNSNFSPTHVPTMNGFWMLHDSNTGGGAIRWARTYPNGTSSASMSQSAGYWGQMHASGHWQQESGDNQWFLVSHFADGGGGWTSALRYAVMFVDSGSGSCRILGHSYSNGSDYYSQPHATISTDGKIVVFGSNMLSSGRVDAFLMETPRAE